MIHSLADHALTYALKLGLLYRDGFGDRALLERIVTSIETFTPARPAGDVVMRYADRAKSVRGGDVRLAAFQSPAPTPMPAECRTARVQIWTPARDSSGAMCILLASTGDEGFLWRERLARRLLAEGIGSIVLENPYYGSRRPHGQRGPVLRTVVDQFAMNTAMVDEARALLGWIRRSGRLAGVTGYSQGGFMAAFAAAFVDFPVVVVARAAGTQAAPVLTEWALRRAVHWPSLARESGGVEAARAELARHLSVVDLTRHPAPVAPELATVMVARHDRVFPEHTGRALHRHWPGSELVVSNASHVTSALFNDDVHAGAVVAAFRRAGAAASVATRESAEAVPSWSAVQPARTLAM
ncbi:MAG: abhydrolase 18 [Myxococcaceae bacterium]|nr:abhydrolase 18 [Myxococcaceae bacterium]